MILTGDCVELMRGLEPASVDAIVTDPPYGLEFMGKEWDRLGDVGQASHGGFTPGMKLTGAGNPTDRIPQASYNASANVKCGRCRKWKWDHEGRKCECGSLAEWPNVKALEGRRMQDWHYAWATEALRVLKPGGHLLAFGGTRTYHRLACAIEDAGFEIRDCLSWLFGSGFPKSLDVSKAIDKAAGVEREPTGREPRLVTPRAMAPGGAERQVDPGLRFEEPATDEARTWQGWGTALKPAYEPIVVARKPLAGTVAGNVLEHGTGALNVDGCRVEHDGSGVWGNHGQNPEKHQTQPGSGGTTMGRGWNRPGSERNEFGRWPANVVLDEEAAAMLDEQTGELQRAISRTHSSDPGMFGFGGAPAVVYPDSGGASRFFYVAKASRAERNAGLEGFEEHEGGAYANGAGMPGRTLVDGEWKQTGTWQEPNREVRRNHHPTVKPVALMRWLVRLVTPPGGTVLDPFTGSGTTGIAAALEGFQFIGMEQDADYAKIAAARIAFWTEHGEEGLRIVAERERAEAEREAVVASGQLELL